MEDQGIVAELETLRAQLKQFEQARLQKKLSVSEPAGVANLQASVTAEESLRDSVEDWLSGLDDLDATQMLERVKDVTGNWFVDINDDLKDVRARDPPSHFWAWCTGRSINILGRFNCLIQCLSCNYSLGPNWHLRKSVRDVP